MALDLLYTLLEPTANMAGAILKAATSLFNTKQLASITGVDVRTTQRWLTNAKERRKPGLDSLRKLARKIGWKLRIIFQNDSDIAINRTVELNPTVSREVGNALAAGNETRAKRIIERDYGIKGFRVRDVESVLPA